YLFFFFQAEDGIRDFHVTGVQTCALPISGAIGGSVARFVRHARIDRDPVAYPRLAAVVGQRLLEAPRVRADLRDDEPDEDRPAIEGIRSIEHAASILELAIHGIGHDAVPAVGEVETPLPGFGVIQAQA